MRKIENKTFGDTIADVDDYATLMTMIVNRPATGGSLHPEQIRMILTLMDKLANPHDGTVLLEESEHAWLIARTNDFPWQMANAEIAKFHDAVLNAPEVEVQEADDT